MSASQHPGLDSEHYDCSSEERRDGRERGRGEGEREKERERERMKDGEERKKKRGRREEEGEVGDGHRDRVKEGGIGYVHKCGSIT